MRKLTAEEAIRLLDQEIPSLEEVKALAEDDSQVERLRELEGRMGELYRRLGTLQRKALDASTQAYVEWTGIRRDLRRME